MTVDKVCWCGNAHQMQEGTENAPLAPVGTQDVSAPITPPQSPTNAQDGRTTAEWIADLVKARQAAEVEVEAMSHEWTTDSLAWESERDERRAEAERLQQVIDGYEVFMHEVSPRRLAAEAKVARVEALANDLEGDYQSDPYGDFYADKIRAALADPEPAQVQQADECAHESRQFDRSVCGACGAPGDHCEACGADLTAHTCAGSPS